MAGLEEFAALEDDGVEVDRDRLVPAAAGEAQELVRQLGAGGGRAQDDVEQLPIRVGSRLRVQHYRGVALDAHQQVVEVVRDAARQRADRVHFLGLQQSLKRFFRFGMVDHEPEDFDEFARGVEGAGDVFDHVDYLAVPAPEAGFVAGEVPFCLEQIQKLRPVLDVRVELENVGVQGLRQGSKTEKLDERLVAGDKAAVRPGDVGGGDVGLRKTAGSDPRRGRLELGRRTAR